MQKYTKFCLKFNNDKDTVIIKALEKSANKTGYIRGLVALDIVRQEHTQMYLTDEEYLKMLELIKELQDKERGENN